MAAAELKQKEVLSENKDSGPVTMEHSMKTYEVTEVDPQKTTTKTKDIKDKVSLNEEEIQGEVKALRAKPEKKLINKLLESMGAPAPGSGKKKMILSHDSVHKFDGESAGSMLDIALKKRDELEKMHNFNIILQKLRALHKIPLKKSIFHQPLVAANVQRGRPYSDRQVSVLSLHLDMKHHLYQTTVCGTVAPSPIIPDVKALMCKTKTSPISSVADIEGMQGVDLFHHKIGSDPLGLHSIRPVDVVKAGLAGEGTEHTGFGPHSPFVDIDPLSQINKPLPDDYVTANDFMELHHNHVLVGGACGLFVGLAFAVWRVLWVGDKGRKRSMEGTSTYYSSMDANTGINH